MFLKRIEMQGFKSFADPTTITFDHPITGIVGPNGCGKSNIADAIRWVLGEQSAKSLRGQRMDDVIFAGSADRRKVNMAEVKLVFDNTDSVLPISGDEVEVTRRLFRDSNDAEYLINQRNVRLKDVVDLFLDTGLGKDSLSIITQGNVLAFAQAKPDERRGIFEEAAGVAKYKKRKTESLSKLNRTQENLDRCSDLLQEMEGQISPLKRQAHKAEIYREKKQKLQDIEISVLTQDIMALKQDQESASQSLFEVQSKVAIADTSIHVLESKINAGRTAVSKMDADIDSLQTKLLKNYQEVQQLEKQRTQLEEKQKYLIQTGDREVRIQELQKQLLTAKEEYQDRAVRLSKLENDVALLKEQLSQNAQSGMEYATNYDTAQMRVNALEKRRDVIDSLLQNPYIHQYGIQTIMAAKNSLPGILGVVGEVLKPEHSYETAIATALGGAINNIITKDEQSARYAISYLNRNESGRATFLPLTVLRPRYLPQDIQLIAENTDGYLGTADEFVSCEKIYEPVVNSLLRTVLVVKDMETGNRLSALTNRSYPIVTLNGEIIHRGGSITGGKNRRDTNIMTMRKEATDIAQALDAAKAKAELAHRQLLKIQGDHDAIANSLQKTQMEIASLEPVVDAKQAKYEKIRNDLAIVKPDLEEANVEQDPQLLLAQKLNKAYQERDAMNASIRTKREERYRLQSETERQEGQLRQLRKDKEDAQKQASQIEIDKSRIDTRIENALNRLSSEYKMTYEHALTLAVPSENAEEARAEVNALRAEIDRLGNVNMEAPEQYAAMNARYEELQKQTNELTNARNKILATIDEMDSVMKKDFKKTFEAVNSAFGDVFKALYGGGSAKLVLQDPDDLLNTGIEIDAQPPGKTVRNNMLFSGGEKSLIALCVLFAILQVKPVPLVILDEVEAALDPGNVERFAQYLTKYTDQTQFIVVTHRVGTMEKCDILYGVTMQKQGVSQMLKVSLKDAAKMAEKPEGSAV